LGRAPIQHDSVAVGAYQIDSHATRKREPEGDNRTLEGFLGLRWLTRTYQIPYGVMVPRRIAGLIVPVAVSATHMGLGTIRMEPCWMQLGYAAGVSADLHLRMPGSDFGTLCPDRLQDELLKDGQRISMIGDVEWDHPGRHAAEYFAAKGVLHRYEAKLEEEIAIRDAALWLAVARSLPGGRSLPALPATDRLLPAGADRGPSFPLQRPEADPETYWQLNPKLPVRMAAGWEAAACRALELPEQEAGSYTGPYVTRGEWLALLYRLLAASRRSID
jgi:hypothetical protein